MKAPVRTLEQPLKHPFFEQGLQSLNPKAQQRTNMIKSM